MSNPTSPQSPIPAELDLSVSSGNVLLADQFFTWLVRILSFTSVLLILAMTFTIGEQSLPALKAFGPNFIFSQDWNVPEEKFGALPYIFGTLVTSAVAIILAFPVAIAVAILTSEDVLPSWVRYPIGYVVELIAAIPSVIVGLWGIFVLGDFLKPFADFLHAYFGWIPLFSTELAGPGILTASVILAVMILPTIASISRDVLLSIPKELRSASMALGGTRWETIFKVILPAALSGLVGATLLGLGRALGETMAVTMVIGNSPQITASLLDLGSTIPAVMANEFAEANSELHVSSLMFLGFLLFFITFSVNAFAVFLVKFFGNKH